jgi:hypothetical protein
VTISEYILVLLSIVVGLGMTHLLSGAAEILQRSGNSRPYWVHTAWMFNLFVTIIHFWWWEFRLVRITTWTFLPYAYVVCYAVLVYLLVAFLMPQPLGAGTDLKEYYYSHRKWFFGTMALIQVFDFGDTLVKGWGYFLGLGLEYVVRNVGVTALCVVAIRTRNERFHGILAIVLTAYQIVWILRQFNTIM